MNAFSWRHRSCRQCTTLAGLTAAVRYVSTGICWSSSPRTRIRPQGARAADARRLLDDVVDLPRALEGEPPPLEAVAGHEAAGFAVFQVRDKADALGREEAKGIRGKAPAIKASVKGPGPWAWRISPPIAGVARPSESLSGDPLPVSKNYLPHVASNRPLFSEGFARAAIL